MSDQAVLVKVYLIFPFLDEAPNLLTLVRDIEDFAKAHPDYLFQIVAIDDGSRDGGGALLKEKSRKVETTVLKNRINLGPGSSFERGFCWLEDKLLPGDLVVTMEADNTSSLNTLGRMLIRIKEGYDAVLASPYSYGGGFSEVSTGRVMISHLANALVKTVLRIRGINTFSSFFRLYRAETIIRLQKIFGPGIIESPGFECMIELLYKMILVGNTISEVEFTLEWEKRAGASKMAILKTARGYLRVWNKKNYFKNKLNPEN